MAAAMITASSSAKRSPFYLQLDTTGRKRYTDKLEMLQLAEDPYLLSLDNFSTDRSSWPPLDFPDIYVYLINSPSPHTKEELKSYKSSQAWSYFVAGFVSDVRVTKLAPNVFLFFAKVSPWGLTVLSYI